jgi:hypothetical protein
MTDEQTIDDLCKKLKEVKRENERLLKVICFVCSAQV